MGGLALLAYAIEQPRQVGRLLLVGTGAGGPAYTRGAGALWNRSHPAFWRMAMLGMLHISWPRRGPEKLMMNFVRYWSFFDHKQAARDSITFRDWFRPRRGHTE